MITHIDSYLLNCRPTSSSTCDFNSLPSPLPMPEFPSPC